MELLTVKETALILRVSPITVRRYIASGKLAAERVGRGVRVRREAIEDFITPIEPATDERGADSRDELPTLRDSIGNIVGIGRSGMPSKISEHKHEYLVDAYLDEDDDDEDDPELDELLGQPFTMDDPLWTIVGIGKSDDVEDVARNKYKYVADAIFADKFPE